MNQNKLFEDQLFKTLSLLAVALARTFGSHCEVVVHDLRDLRQSIVHIENHHVTGRSVGDSVLSRGADDRGLALLKRGIQEEMLINYPTSSSNGKMLKSTTVVIKNLLEEPVAALCMNFDVTDIDNALRILGDVFKVQEGSPPKQKNVGDDIMETVSRMIHTEIERYPCAINAMKKQDRLDLVKSLNDQGVFATKGAVKIVAGKLNVSKHTIYSYLDEIKTGRIL